MRLTRSDMTISLSGAGVALAAGLLLGGAMQPHLDEGARGPAGPQMFADWAGDRSTGPFDPGTTFVSYQGKIPDYVLGTDWKKRMTWPDESAAVPAPREETRYETSLPPEAPATLTRTAYEDLPPPTHAYPSLGGAPPSAIDAAPPAADEAPGPAAGG